MASDSAAPTAELSKLSIDKTNGSAKPANGSSNGASGGGSSGTGDFREQFKAFSKFGDIKSDGKQITLTQSDKWMKQAKVIDKKITTTDTAIHFKKLKAIKVSFTDYNKFLEDLATTKKVELSEIKEKLAGCGAPGVPKVDVSRKSRNLVSPSISKEISFVGWQSCCGSEPFDRCHQIHRVTQGTLRRKWQR